MGDGMSSDFRYSEALSVLRGDFLGEGSARKVYALLTNSAYVLKIETAGRSFQNVAEWEYWKWVKGTKLEKWFAPCERISARGLLLVQRRVDPPRLAELPKKVPAFLTDLKIENFGLLDGKFVCCDYGTCKVVLRHFPQRLVAAKWR